MDEDQQNEEQQQEQKQDIAQSAFNVFQRLNLLEQSVDNYDKSINIDWTSHFIIKYSTII